MSDERYRVQCNVQFCHRNEFSSNCSLRPKYNNPLSVILIDIYKLVSFVDSRKARNRVNAHWEHRWGHVQKATPFSRRKENRREMNWATNMRGGRAIHLVINLSSRQQFQAGNLAIWNSPQKDRFAKFSSGCCRKKLFIWWIVC